MRHFKIDLHKLAASHLPADEKASAGKKKVVEKKIIFIKSFAASGKPAAPPLK